MKPDTIWLTVDVSHVEAADLHDAHGDTIHGVDVVKETLLDDCAHCETCDADPDGAYVLAGQGDRYGVPVCLPCLLGHEWVEAVTDSTETLA